MNAQNEALPYYEIPSEPETFTGENVAARFIDGLGFRYYWATEGLREEDLAYKGSSEARTSAETIDHIYGLTRTILKAIKGSIEESRSLSDMTFEEKRVSTLMNIKESSDLLKSGTKLEDCPMIFQRGENRTEFSFWYLANGPIADALWHVGQVVTFRRSSGNPYNSKASVLTGTVSK